MSGPRRKINGEDAVEITIRLTEDEYEMLQTLARRSVSASEQGVIRRLIREAWIDRQTNVLRRKTKRRRHNPRHGSTSK